MAAIPEIGSAVVVGIPTATAGRSLVGQGGWLLGWCLAETTGAAVAVAALYDGQDATGQLLAYVAIPAGQTVAVPVSVLGSPFLSGLYLAVISGSVAGSVTIGLPA